MSRGARPTTRRSPALGGRELRARVSAGEYRQVQAAAEAEGMTVPAYIRAAALSGRYRALLSTVMAEVGPVELERPLPMVGAVDAPAAPCLTCRNSVIRGGRYACLIAIDADMWRYLRHSGALVSNDGLPTDRAMRCPGWAAKETT